MNIFKVEDCQKMRFMELLLLADEEVNMIERYLWRGEMFALRDEDIRAVCVVTDEGAGNYELKNIAVKPEYQRMGYGKKLVSFLNEHYRNFGKTLSVETGDSPSTIGFYRCCGFAYSHTAKNFFTDNYKRPIVENGKRLTDMIYLKKTL